MPGWNEVLNEIAANNNNADVVRQKYVAAYSAKVGRNVICFYSGWLQKQNPANQFLVQISDDDKHSFMNAIHGLDCTRGLDLILHLPGGDLAATESLLHYLRSKFGNNIRTVVPQISMSGGTMLAFAGQQIVMARHSNLGPIDPQLGDMSVVDILSEWHRASNEIVQEPRKEGLWRSILSKYPLGFVTLCEQIREWGSEIATHALETGMFETHANRNDIIKKIVDRFASKLDNKSHARHLHREECQALGLDIVEAESDPAYQDHLLTVHHAFMITFSMFNVAKIVENQEGRTKVQFL